MGFPAAAAQQQVERVIDALVEMGPEEETLSDLLLPYCFVMSDLADAGLHDVAGIASASSCRRCNSRTCATAPCWRCWRRWRGMNRTLSEYLLRDSDFDTEFATLRQARAIITMARRQGLDSVKLSKLAAAMGHEAEELGVNSAVDRLRHCEHPVGRGS